MTRREGQDLRVTTITVSDELEEKRALARGHPVACVLGTLPRRDDVHAVDLNARDLVTAGEVLGVGRAALSRRAHAVLVVFADEDDGKVPQLGHVVGLKDLTLVACTITIEGEAGSILAKVLLSESETGTNWYLRADDTVTAEESRREDVHRTTLAARHAVLATEELSKNTLDGTATEDGEGVAAVRGDDQVLRRNGSLETDRNSFLKIKSAYKLVELDV